MASGGKAENGRKSTRERKPLKMDDYEYEPWSASPYDVEFPTFQASNEKPVDAKQRTPPKLVSPPKAQSRANQSEPSIAEQIHLETLKQTNLSMELEISKNKLHLAKLEQPKSSRSAVISRSKTPQLEADNGANTGRKPNESLHQDLEDFLLPTLANLRKKNDSKEKWLPHQYVLSTKGALDYKDITLSEFVLGFLEMIKDLPHDESKALLRYLSLLMEKATSYSWRSVRNFHFSMNKTITSGRCSWSSWDFIHSKAATAFSHADLLSAISKESSSSAAFSQKSSLDKSGSPNSKASYCKQWNYQGSCSCSKVDSDYKNSHKCKVCDAIDHPMLSCKKRRWPVPSFTSQKD